MYGSLEEVRRYFEATTEQRARWRRRNAYYYRKVAGYYRSIVPEGSTVLEVGSGSGDLLAVLKPGRGLGIDASRRAVAEASAKYPGLEFREGFAETFRTGGETFDYVVMADLMGHLDDVQRVLENVRHSAAPSTRVVLHCYNFIWEIALRSASAMGLRMPERLQNWLSMTDLENLLHISGFETVHRMHKLLVPVGIPFLSEALNRFVANLPVIRHLCLMQFIVARPKPVPAPAAPSVSIVVPSRNEKGNIAELVERIPEFPAGLEVVFVDGGSDDGTTDEIRRAAERHPAKNVRLFLQEGRGKGAAVRQGFAACSGDVLMILDADLSVAPEDTRRFYDLIASGIAEFVNGTRMVYPMERQAMRFLNILGNKFFSMCFTYLLDQPVRDTLCGTKALSREHYARISRNRPFFGDFDPFGDFDLLFGAAKLNLKIVELPVRYYERRYGITKIHRFRHGLLLLKMCAVAARRLKFI